MECFNVMHAVQALLGATLIVAGSNLMSSLSKVERGYGAYCLAFGYLILGVSAAGQSLPNINFASRRYLLGVGSVIAIVAGQFMIHYHVQNKVAEIVKANMNGLPVVQEDIIKSIPVIDHILVYGGFAGLVATIAMKNNNSFNLVKGSLALGSVLVIGYTRGKYIESMITGQSLEKNQVAHILSWGLLVLAIAYSC